MGICVSKEKSYYNNECEFCKILKKKSKIPSKLITIDNKIKCTGCNSFLNRESLSGEIIYF
jgi:hypothetical protein